MPLKVHYNDNFFLPLKLLTFCGGKITVSKSKLLEHLRVLSLKVLIFRGGFLQIASKIRTFSSGFYFPPLKVRTFSNRFLSTSKSFSEYFGWLTFQSPLLKLKNKIYIPNISTFRHIQPSALSNSQSTYETNPHLQSLFHKNAKQNMESKQWNWSIISAIMGYRRYSFFDHLDYVVFLRQYSLENFIYTWSDI